MRKSSIINMVNDRPKRRHSKLRIAAVIHIVLFLLIGFGFGEEYLRNKDIEDQIARMQAENAELDADRLSSLKLIDTLSSSYYVESEARQSGMGKPGEQLIIVQEGVLNGSTTTTTSTHSDVPNPLRWYQYFFDHDAFAELTNV